MENGGKYEKSYFSWKNKHLLLHDHARSICLACLVDEIEDLKYRTRKPALFYVLQYEHLTGARDTAQKEITNQTDYYCTARDCCLIRQNLQCAL